MKKIFVDSDIILDLLKRRIPFFESAEKLFVLADNQRVSLFTSALIFANLHYILSKTEGKENAKSILRNLRILVKLLPVSVKNIDEAMNSNFTDFEDSVEHSVAIENKMEMIITRNEKDFKNSQIPVMSAEAFLQTL